MKLTSEELQTVKCCLDIALTQLGEISILREKVVKLLDKIGDLDEDENLPSY